MKHILVFFLLFVSIRLLSQTYHQEVTAILSSDSLHGRGYVNEGIQKAADYLEEEFRRLGVQPVEGTYRQEFYFPVNTFPSRMRVELNGNELRPGIDYLVDPASPGIQGEQSLVYFDSEDLLDEDQLEKLIKKSAGKFIVFEFPDPDAYPPEKLREMNQVIQFFKYNDQAYNSGVIELTRNKLTWSVSPGVNGRPILVILEEAFPKKAKTINLRIDQRFIREYETENIIGRIPGKRGDSTLVLTAHYDHLGRMGKETLFPGANDNASGVAMLLTLARHYTESTPPFDIILIAFTAEEAGLIGSRFFVENPMVELEKIRFLINFDLAGTGEEGIQVVNGSIFSVEFSRLSALNSSLELLKQVRIRGEACNSDHCYFFQAGVPCFFIYTLGGGQAYHDVNDQFSNPSFFAFENYRDLMIRFMDGFGN